MVAPAGLRMEEAGREGELHRTLLIGAQAALEAEGGRGGEGGGGRQHISGSGIEQRDSRDS